MSRNDARWRALAVRKVQASNGRQMICPDCDGTGRGYTDQWPYDMRMVTCRRCHGDCVVPSTEKRPA